MTGRLLFVYEVAERLRAPLSTVRYWISQGRLPSTKPGRRRMVREQDLEAFVARHMKGRARVLKSK